MRRGKLYASGFGTRGRGEGRFAEQVSELFDLACRRAGLGTEIPTLSASAFCRPSHPVQLDLFSRDS
jgi:hypothetical protein